VLPISIAAYIGVVGHPGPNPIRMEKYFYTDATERIAAHGRLQIHGRRVSAVEIKNIGDTSLPGRRDPAGGSELAAALDAAELDPFQEYAAWCAPRCGVPY
jgi:hypothetical protein